MMVEEQSDFMKRYPGLDILDLLHQGSRSRTEIMDHVEQDLRSVQRWLSVALDEGLIDREVSIENGEMQDTYSLNQDVLFERVDGGDEFWTLIEAGGDRDAVTHPDGFSPSDRLQQKRRP